MTFDPSNREHKRRLYPILRALADLDPTTSPEEMIDQACGKPLIRGKDYIHNVRKGDYAKSVAQFIYNWIEAKHFDLAHRLAPDIFTETPDMRFTKLVEEHAVRGKLRIVFSDKSFGIVERASKTKDADATIRLGQEFYFELDCDEPGYAVAFQGLRGKWHPIPLGPYKEPSVDTRPGLNRFPQKDDGQPDPLIENHDMGVHQFVVVTAAAPAPPSTSKTLLSYFAGGKDLMQKLTVKFIE